jgi:hypothetical protein
MNRRLQDLEHTSNRESHVVRGIRLLAEIRSLPNGFSSFEGQPLLPPCVVDIIQDRNQTPNEHHVVGVITPYIDKLRQGNASILLFNSEDHKYLNGINNDLPYKCLKKPDLNFAHGAVVTSKTRDRDLGEFPSGATTEEDAGWPEVFGVMQPSRHKRYFINMLAEAKPDDGELPPPNGFSELDDYYRHMNLPVCGILLNRKCWGIYRFDPQANNKDTHVVAYGEGKHGDLGSFDFICEFLQRYPCPYIGALDELAKAVGCSLQPELDPLGAGLDSIVLKVLHEGQQRALKVAVGVSGESVLNSECDAHNTIQFPSLCSLAIAPKGHVHCIFSTTGSLLLCGLLFEHAGTPIPSKSRLLRETIRGCMETLASFHAQQISHGDPRIDNFVVIEDDVPTKEGVRRSGRPTNRPNYSDVEQKKKFRYALIDWARACSTVFRPEEDVRIIVSDALGERCEREAEMAEPMFKYLENYENHQQLADALFTATL